MENVVREILRNVCKNDNPTFVKDIMNDWSLREELVKELRRDKKENYELYADFLENMKAKTIQTTYAPDSDMTFILQYTNCIGEGYDMEVIGYYHGEPNAEVTKRYSYTLKQV